MTNQEIKCIILSKLLSLKEVIVRNTNRICIVCGGGEHHLDPPVKKYKFNKSQFYVCNECAAQKICPQCRGRGEIALKERGDPVKIQTCDLCFGTGSVNYRTSLSPNLEDYKMIKVPAWVYDNLKQTKIALERKRVALNPDLTAPDICPRCGERMETLNLKYEYNKCLTCGYTQQRIDFSATGHIALGIIIGLGAAALWHYITENS